MPKVPPLKELRAVHIGHLIINSVRRMKSTTCLHPKSPLRKRGVERAKLKFKNYFPDREFDTDFTLKKLEYQWQKYKEGYFHEIPVRDQFFKVKSFFHRKGCGFSFFVCLTMTLCQHP